MPTDAPLALLIHRFSRRMLSVLLAVLAAAAGAGPALAGRGEDGTVKILFWQAVSTLNPYLSGGSKDVYAASIVLEPLAVFDDQGQLAPRLAAEIPTRENGGISEDLTTITWKLRPGLTWSDGLPVTAEDMVFTWTYCLAPDGGCAQKAKFEGITAMQALDPLTLKITFAGPQSYPYTAFVGNQAPVLQQAQFRDCLGAKAPQCTEANFKPHGTGPYVVADLKPNDVVTFTANPRYRDADRPAFSTVVLKGGGDSISAARAVLETGEFDFAWNTVVEPEVAAAMEQGGRGKIAMAFNSTVERVIVNPYRVDPALGAKRSTREAGPHPALSDPAVRRALALAIDREVIVEAGYGAAGKPTCNIIPAPEAFASTAKTWCERQDLEAARALLDQAGWRPGPDGIRAKGGVKLDFLFVSTTNSVRQGTQSLLKDMWAQIGVAVELRNVSASVFFGGDPASPDTYQKFYADLMMYASGFQTTDPEKFLAGFTCSKIPAPDTRWQGENVGRYCDPDYDAMVRKLSATADPAARAEEIRALNDKVVNAGWMIPLVHRGEPSAISNRLADVKLNPWDSQLWNIEAWRRRP